MSKMVLTIQDFFNLPSARIYNPDMLKNISAVTIDSRHVPSNSLFIALKGDKLDGHSFVKDALKKGASAVMINEDYYQRFRNLDLPVITVNETIKALGTLASAWRNKLHSRVIGITGSTGKTSVKEFLSILLNERYSVNKTLANHNNHIGVPLTLFSTNNTHDYLVLEMGTNHFGEIEYTSGIANPVYALITNIGNSHLAYLMNKKGVLKEKSALYESVIKNHGTIFINNDDPLLRKTYPKYQKRVTFALENNADIRGRIITYTRDGRAVVELRYKKIKFNVELPVWGIHTAANFIAAAAVALKEGLTGREIINGAEKFKTFEKRFNLKKIKDTIIIDDTYNANPDSMTNAIFTLKNLYPGKTKIAVLGDMLELGSSSPGLHISVAKKIKQCKLDKVYTIGTLSQKISDYLNSDLTEARHFISRSSLRKFLERQDFSGSVVLFKGSRGMKMEEFLEVTENKLKN